MPLNFHLRRVENFFISIASRWVFTTLAIIIMGVSGYLSIHAAMQMTNTVGTLIEIQKRREAVLQLLSYLKDTERGERGFLLSGDDAYLEPYVVGKSSALQMMVRLKQIHQGDGSWTDTLEYIEQQIHAKLFEMDELIHTREESGLNGALLMFKTNESRRLMENIQMALSQMMARESNILSMDNFNYRTVMSEAVVGFSVSNVLVLGLMVVTLMMIESRRRLLAQQVRAKSVINRELNTLKAIELNEVSGAEAITRLREVRGNLSEISESSVFSPL